MPIKQVCRSFIEGLSAGLSRSDDQRALRILPFRTGPLFGTYRQAES